MSALSQKHLTGLKNLQKSDIELIFQTADNFKDVLQRPIKKVPSLRDITIANLFFEDSTRTRMSFELAEKRLSADTINFSASGSSVKKGETLLDTVRNILAMKVDMIVMRHYSSGAANFIAQNVNVNVVNAGDGTHEHPHPRPAGWLLCPRKIWRPERVELLNHRRHKTQPRSRQRYTADAKNGRQSKSMRPTYPGA